MFLLAQIKKDFLWDFSYKISFFGQFLGIFLTTFTFFFISKTFEASESIHLAEYRNNYFFFAVIGISIVDLITLCLRSATRCIREAQAFGYIDMLLNSRLSITYLVLASMMYPLIVGVFKVFIYLLIAIILKDHTIDIINILLIIFLSVLTLLPFIGFGLIASSFVLYFKQGDPINFLIGLIISIFSGVVFPVSVLPEILRYISEIIPLTYGLEIIRKVVIFNSPESVALSEIGFMISFSVFFLLIGVLTINKTVYSIKFSGTSGRY